MAAPAPVLCRAGWPHLHQSADSHALVQVREVSASEVVLTAAAASQLRRVVGRDVVVALVAQGQEQGQAQASIGVMYSDRARVDTGGLLGWGLGCSGAVGPAGLAAHIL